MEAYEYATLYEYETFYWWYRGLHSILLEQLLALNLPPSARVLDAGCGSGQNLWNLQRRTPYEAFGFDFSAHASKYWKVRDVHRAALASINDIPFPEASFDAVMSVDVLESDAVDEAAACGELWRVTRAGGFVILVVPAYKWLLTEEHHRAVHASRRYTRRDAVGLLKRFPAEIVRCTHLFAILFPAIAAYRLALRQRPKGSAEPHSELQRFPAPVNALFTQMMELERRVVRHIDLPVGSSILLIARKPSL
jgi:SAM-dependent methyltransferase